MSLFIDLSAADIFDFLSTSNNVTEIIELQFQLELKELELWIELLEQQMEE
jgi:hypothetical protein